MRTAAFVVLLAILLRVGIASAGEGLGLRFPDGFEVSEYASSDLATDIYTVKVDPRGRLLVSGRGYIRILEDEDGDGKADKAIPFANVPKDGAMGLLWEGNQVFFTGDGGLHRLKDDDGDDRADGPAELICKLKTGDEHAAHAIRRGADGWLYVLCGNSSGLSEKLATLPTSPIRTPVAGCLLRFSPDLKNSEIVADGFRNPYDFDMNGDGEWLVHDSDNERCVSLPWYEFTRCYHVMDGTHHGWRSHERGETWRWPPSFLDVNHPVRSIARGSPTGVACYRHRQFPEHYRGGVFLADWTFGKIFYLPLVANGSSYASGHEVFLESTGSNGFAPTGLAVHPATGDLFISIGGRGSRGAVYRVRYSEGKRSFNEQELAAFQPEATSLDWRPDLKTTLPAKANGTKDRMRRHALILLRRFRDKFADPEIEAVVRANLGSADRGIIQANAALLETLPMSRQLALLDASKNQGWTTLTIAFALTSSDPKRAGDAANDLLARSSDDQVQLAAARVLELAVGDVTERLKIGSVWEGYSRFKKGPIPPKLAETLRARYLTGRRDLDRELLRIAAMTELEDAELLSTIATSWTKSSDPVSDIHSLIAFARMSGSRTEAMTRASAHALLELDAKIHERKLKRDRNWPHRIRELHAGLVARDANFNAALLADESFGRPDHAIFVDELSINRELAAKQFWKKIEADSDYEWNGAVVELLGALPRRELLPRLRPLWDHASLRAAILEILAQQPESVDHDKFLAALGWTEQRVVLLGLEALEKLPPAGDEETVIRLVQAYRKQPRAQESESIRGRFVRLLASATREMNIGDDREAWIAWAAKRYPGRAPELLSPDGIDRSGWEKRFASISWETGDAARGRVLFTNAGCMSCHTGGRAVGPSLAGASRRFSRGDLFTSIIDPSRDVSERYQTEVISTDAGELFQGMVVYEAIDSLILQTGADRTVRIEQESVSERRRSRTSLMPAGLLDKCTGEQIADLFAYLNSLDQE
ncbi:MAG: hypothetical protein U1D30_14070 [Planctomycetota bacterium]